MPMSASVYRVQLGQRLRSFREGRDVTQKDLIAAIGLGRQATLSQYENGKRDAPFVVVHKICTELDISLDVLTEMDFDEAIKRRKIRRSRRAAA